MSSPLRAITSYESFISMIVFKTISAGSEASNNFTPLSPSQTNKRSPSFESPLGLVNTDQTNLLFPPSGIQPGGSRFAMKYNHFSKVRHRVFDFHHSESHCRRRSAAFDTPAPYRRSRCA